MKASFMGASAFNIHYFSLVHKVVYQKVHKVVVHKVVYQKVHKSVYRLFSPFGGIFAAKCDF